MGEAFGATCIYSIICDYFPMENRVIPNACICIGYSLGMAFDSLCTLLLSNIGWRNTYIFVGSLNTFLGLLNLFFLREPERGKYDIKTDEGTLVNQGFGLSSMAMSQSYLGSKMSKRSVYDKQRTKSDVKNDFARTQSILENAYLSPNIRATDRN